jgi:membrane protein required for colicin V production
LVYKAQQQGLLTTAIRLAGLILGIIVATNLGKNTADLLMNNFSISPQLANILGHIAIFLIVILAAQVLGYFLRSIIHAVKLGWLDKIGGVLLGILKSAVIISFLFWILLALPSKTLGDDIQNKSVAYRILGKFTPSLYEKYIEPNLDEGDMKDRIDSLISPGHYSSNSVSEFDKQIEVLIPDDQKIAKDMKKQFKSLAPSQQKLIISKLLEGNPDLQEIINILYESE